MLWWLSAQGRQRHRRRKLEKTGRRPPLVIEHYRTDRAFQRAAESLTSLGYAMRSQGYSSAAWPRGGWVVTYQYVAGPGSTNPGVAGAQR